MLTSVIDSDIACAAKTTGQTGLDGEMVKT